MGKTKNLFKEEWKLIEKEGNLPNYLENIVEMDWNEFKSKILEQDPKFVSNFVGSIYNGDIYLLKGAIQKEELTKLKHRLYDWSINTPSQALRKEDSPPNFHSLFNKSSAVKYDFEIVRKAFYFFRWNEDEFKVFENVSEPLSILKVLSGNRYDAFVNNCPEDGIIDRPIAMQYPSGAGYGKLHTDPFGSQKVIMGVTMSQKGEDYQSGGVYVLNKNKEKVNLDKEVNVGDIHLIYPSLYHGIDMIDEGTTPDWNSINGRWYMGLQSLVTEFQKDRIVGKDIVESIDIDEY